MSKRDSQFNLRRRRFAKSVATVGTAGLFAGCLGDDDDDPLADDSDDDDTQNGDDDDGDSTDRGGTAILWTGSDAETLDPRLNLLTWYGEAAHYMFDPLVMLSPDGSEVVPHLAADGLQEEDELTWTIPIREGVLFHDGEELTAEDVEFSFNWMLDPDNESPHRLRFDFIDEVEATGEYEVTFHLLRTNALFERRLTSMEAPIIPKHVAEGISSGEFAENPIGSGPFQFDAHVPDSELSMTVFDEYFLGEPTLDGIDHIVIPEPEVAYVDLATGAIHRSEIPSTLIEDAESNDEVDHKFLSNLSNDMLVLNCLEEPFGDIRAREAMHYLVDYDDLMTAAVEDLGTRTWGYMSGELVDAWGFPQEDWEEQFYPQQDHDQAIELFEETETGLDFEPLIRTSPSPFHQGMATVLQNEFEQIGVEAQVEASDVGTWIQSLLWGDNHDIIAWGMTGIEDPDDGYRLLRDFENDDPPPDDTRGGFPMGYMYDVYRDTGTDIWDDLVRLDELVREGGTIMDQSERYDMYVEAAEIAQGLYPSIPVYSETVALGWRPELEGYEPTQFGEQELFNEWQQVWIPE